MTKNDANIEKHGLDFTDAVRVFADRCALHEVDDRKDYGETRTNIVGEVSGRVVCVIFTQRGDAIRLISARIAHRKERIRYGKRTDR